MRCFVGNGCVRLNIAFAFLMLPVACTFGPRQGQLPKTFKTVSEIQAIPLDRIPHISREQIQSLGAELIAAFSRDQFQAFTPEQISWFTPDQVPFWTLKQIFWMVREQIQALTGVQIKALTLDQVLAFSFHQVKHFLPEQLKSMSPAHIQKLSAKTLTAQHLKSLTVGQRQAILPSEMARMSQEVLRTWPVTSLSREQLSAIDMKKLSEQQIQSFSLNQIPTFTPEQIFDAAYYFTHNQFHHITKSQFQNIHPPAMGAIVKFNSGKFLKKQVQFLTKAQVGKLHPHWVPASFYALFTEDKIPFLNHLPDISEKQAQSLSSLKLQSFTYDQIKIILLSGKVKFFTKDQIQGISDYTKLAYFMRGFQPVQVTWLTKDQLFFLPLHEFGRHGAGSVASGTDQQYETGRSLLSWLSVEQFQWIPPSSLEKIPAINWKYFTPSQFQAMTVKRMRIFDRVPGLYLVDCCVSAATKWVLPFNKKEQIQALSLKQIPKLLRSHPRQPLREYIPLSPQQISYLTVQQLQSLTPAQIRVLTKGQIQAIRPEYFGQWATKASSLKGTEKTQGPYNTYTVTVVYKTYEQVQAFTPYQIPFITVEQISAMSVDQFRVLSYEQISAFTSQQARAVSEEQYRVLSPESQQKIQALKSSS